MTLADSLAALNSLLESQGIAHALIGGWAVIAWGYVRGSDDLDLLVDLPAGKRAALMKGLQPRWDLPVDLLPVRSAADLGALDRAKTIRLEGASIRVVTPEDLIAMKLEAGGGQNYEDVRRLLALAKGLSRAALERACAERRVSDRLKLALASRRDRR